MFLFRRPEYRVVTGPRSLCHYVAIYILQLINSATGDVAVHGEKPYKWFSVILKLTWEMDGELQIK